VPLQLQRLADRRKMRGASRLSTTMVRHSRLKSSTMAGMRKRRPSLSMSETKSSDQRWLMVSGRNPAPPLQHRPVQYLNNILEQDHRAIKRRVKAKQSFREFRAAGRTLAGYESIHMIRKGQARWLSSDDVRKQSQFINKLFDLAA
jgi:hypothetical protein